MSELRHGGCCAPVREATSRPRSAEPAQVQDTAGATDLVALDGGWFTMGSDDAYAYEEDGEGPVRCVRVDPFSIAAHSVSNRQFSEFVDATGHITSAEHYGTSFVFGGL